MIKFHLFILLFISNPTKVPASMDLPNLQGTDTPFLVQIILEKKEGKEEKKEGSEGRREEKWKRGREGEGACTKSWSSYNLDSTGKEKPTPVMLIPYL